MQPKLFTIILLVAVLYGCKKTAVSDDNNGGGGTGPVNPPVANARLSYGDSLFYLRNNTTVYNILPVSRPAVAGKFKSFPVGLLLDSITGNINVSASETGVRYKIYYLNNNNIPVDSVKLVVSGVDYRDSIFQISSTPILYDTSFPIYNATPGLALPCDEDDDDNDGGCIFDETDLDDDGDDDIDGVNQEKLLVDEKRGFIDVEASFRAGIFGSQTPANGLSKDFTFYYRLTDPSNRALNKITVRVYHYRTRADIPQALLDTLNERRAISTAANNRSAVNMNAGRNLQGDSNQEGGYYDEFVGFISKARRPPIIIIVSQ